MTRTYAITGSASGIGAATRSLIEQAGDRVIGIDRHDAEVLADLATTQGRATMVDQVSKLCGGSLDAIIAAAGIGGGEGNPEAIIRVNYFGAEAALRGLRPLLLKGRDPRAAVIASVASLRSEREDPVVTACLDGDERRAVSLVGGNSSGSRAYAASKRALVRHCRRIAVDPEWASAGIPVNAVAPGVVATPMSQYLIATPDAEARTRRELPMPLHGIGRPEHVGSLLVWLTSPANVLTTGQLIFVDGGYESVLRGDDGCFFAP